MDKQVMDKMINIIDNRLKGYDREIVIGQKEKYQILSTYFDAYNDLKEEQKEVSVFDQASIFAHAIFVKRLFKEETYFPKRKKLTDYLGIMCAFDFINDFIEEDKKCNYNEIYTGYSLRENYTFELGLFIMNYADIRYIQLGTIKELSKDLKKFHEDSLTLRDGENSKKNSLQ